MTTRTIAPSPAHLNIYFDGRHTARPLNRRDTPERPTSNAGGMFGTIKRKLSRRSSNPRDASAASPASASAPNSKPARTRSGGLAPPRSSNPFTSGSPATRRPNRAFLSPSNDPPPAYTPGPAARSASPTPSVSSTSDDEYTFLKSFDTKFLIDDSGSMAGRSWRETRQALERIAPICTARDADGIDIHFLNHPDSSIYENIKSSSTVREIFETVGPGGGTPTGQRLNALLKKYLDKYQARPDTTKPLNIIVITDGEPSDDVESPIINAAKKLDKLDAPSWQVGIQFFQVGNEPGAREHLSTLDNGLREIAGVDDLRDMVDTVPFKDNKAEDGEDTELSSTGILKVVLGSVNRRLDRNSRELHRRA